MKFLAQTVNNKITLDFVFELQNSIEYWNWRIPNSMYIEYCSLDELKNGITFIDSDEINSYIPVGTIEFVYTFINMYIKDNGSSLIKPMNVPTCLFEYAGGFISNIIISDYIDKDFLIESVIFKNIVGNAFIKSNDIIKSNINGIYSFHNINDIKNFPNGIYQVRQYRDIVSEYRCFIYNQKLVGIQYYNKDFTVFPNINTVNEMIKTCNDNNIFNANTAYTLDVGITKDNETIIIECHDFYSCGLYGFNDYSYLPYMFSRSFKQLIKQINE